jgi:hypothetical protein
MKKIIFVIVIASVFLISARKQPTRFATPEEMAKALLSALQKNDFPRYLQLYPTQEETNTAFVDPWKDSSIYDHQVEWAGKYYKDNNAMIYEQFRKTREEVIKEGIDWTTVQFVGINYKKNRKSSTGIDYLYRVSIHCTSGEKSVDIKLTYVMQTKEGWNCGLGMQAQVNIPRTQAEREKEVQRLVDSINMADSMRFAFEMAIAAMKADSARMADSFRIVDSLQRADMENRKRPR